MAKPTANSKEIILNSEELFFSRTDEKGIILSGNDIFVKVSGYRREELIQNPHNIVRHPDMPKAVFKLFWQTIQAQQPICAYVKNMAADGSYYWVFATAFPLPGNGYLSVRIKPSAPFFSLVKELYPKIIEKEKREGIEAGLLFLKEALKQKGLDSYEQFMGRAIVDEVRARAGMARQRSGQRGGGESQAMALLREMSQKCTMNSDKNALIFSKLDDFARVNSELTQKSAFILKSFKNLDLLAINMSTAAKRLGSMGATLVAVADGITKSAGEFKGDLNRFNASAKKVAMAIEAAAFRIAASQLQVDMIDFYIQETLQKWSNSAPNPEELQDMKTNLEYLVGLSSDLTSRLQAEMGELKQVLTQIGADSEQLRGTINGVEIIRKTGVIEAAQVNNEGGEFTTYFRVMNQLVGETSRQLATFSDAVRISVQNIEEIIPALNKISGAFAELRRSNEQLAI
ncbi:MAG: hypothetical protein A2070_11970 [Bdellovibrionales bacterium GWC1_52_8]|nr:MAG: hypothetical protein A2Z97_07345 [Bdellovibrionales bacterium GWB1_52_6]OFZ06504.1 MAG: hypothetical protein A2X97_16935 [Bdellovibrionales bacterium GWA1_52_35]OFZ42519.1 MAG: hypothetical protein A2070_11970 [Bdellovibrionales bacterium GWC1_52_8]